MPRDDAEEAAPEITSLIVDLMLLVEGRRRSLRVSGRFNAIQATGIVISALQITAAQYMAFAGYSTDAAKRICGEAIDKVMHEQALKRALAYAASEKGKST